MPTSDPTLPTAVRSFCGAPRRALAAVAVIALGLLAGAGAACGPSASSQAEDRREIEQLLADYLPALAEYYRTGDPGATVDLAVPKEVDHVNRWVLERGREGRVVDPTLESVEIETLDVYQHSNAILTTQEVWDLRIRATGSGRVIQEELDKPDRFRYQLKRGDDGRWRVLSREVVQ